MKDHFKIPIQKSIAFIRRHEVICLFGLVYLVYNINGRPIGSGDTIPAAVLPFSILENHNLYLDQFSNYYKLNFDSTYFLVEKRGHILSFYPIVTPILITPLYVLPYLIIKLANFPMDLFQPVFFSIVHLMEKFAASLIASLSVVFVFLSLKELVNARTATIVAMIFALATNTWTISSQGLWQHGLVELLLAMSIYLVLIHEKHNSNRAIIALGILSGLFIFNRPIDSILLIPVIYYILKLRGRRAVYYIIAAALSSTPFIIYNIYYFGNLFGGYNSLIGVFDLSSGVITRLMGLLISPSRGLIVYTPIILLSVLGYFNILKMPNNIIKKFLLILGISMATQILVYSAFGTWWAGWSYGPRFLTGILPGLAIFMGLFMENIKFNKHNENNLLVFCIIFILLAWSFFAQLVGAFYYPNGNWDGDPNVDQHPEKLWYWNDTQIMRSFSAGMIPPENPTNFLRSIVNLIFSDKRGAQTPIRDILADGNLGGGWFGLETWGNTTVRWMENDALIQISSQENRTANLSITATSFYRPRTLEVYSGTDLVAREDIHPVGFTKVISPVVIDKGINFLRLHVPEGCERPYDMPEMKSRNTRCMSVAVQNITIT